jgi:16S rRNA (cytidine1402-2'-O)-methyltransferase
MAALAQDLAQLGERKVTLGRELTKQFEDIVTLRCDELAAWLAADAHRSKGEFALVVHPLPAQAHDDEDLSPETLRVLGLLLQELPVKTAARLGADITGETRNRLYQAALAIKGQ